MWDFFIRNNRFAYLFLIALIAVGTYSLLSIPRESAPEVVIPVGVVTTVLPGAPAADIESLVTNEIERGLVSLENVSEITSTSREGVSSVVVEFDADADLDDSIQDLKDQVDTLQSELPEDAEDSSVSEVNFVDQPILTVSVAGELSDIALTEIADDLERDLEAIPGVSRVAISGVREKALTVIVDQTALERFSLSLTEITNAIRSANQTFPIGQIENDGISYNVAFEGDIADAAALANIGITNRGGQPIFLKDIATIEDGLADATTISRLSVDGQPSQSAMSVSVFKQTGGNIVAVTQAVNQRIEALQQPGELLSGLTAETVLDAGADINEDLIRLTLSGLQTVSLVVLLLVVALGWREGLLAGTAIPLSFLFGFIGLYFSGNTINFLSLFSLILGIGILVDSAIVMTEGINRKMKDDPTIDKRQAAIDAIHEFATPLIAGTLTTVSMFVGLFIVSGVIGQFIASIPFTLIFLLFASLFVALAILPLLAASFLRRRSSTKLEQRQVAYAQQLESWYRGKLAPYLDSAELQSRFLSGIVAALVFAIFLAIDIWTGLIAAPLVYLALILFRRWHPQTKIRSAAKFVLKPLALGVAIATAVGITWFLPSWNPVQVVFFEVSDSEYVIVEVENPEGTTKEVTDIDVRRVEEILLDEPEIESYTVTVGSGSDFGSGGSGEKLANLFITLREDRDRPSTEILADYRAQLAVLNDLKIRVTQLSDGPPTGAAIVIKFLGDDLSELTRLANEAASILRGLENTVNVETSTNNNNTEFVLTLDRAKAAAAGVSPVTVSQTARAAVFGSDVTAITTLTDDISITVKLNVSGSANPTSETTNNTTITALESVTIPSPSGPIALGNLVDVSLRESSSVINHEDNERVVSITADVSDEGNARELQATAVTAIEEQLAIPEGVTISTGGGETEESNEAFFEMFLALIVGVLLMVAVLTLQFNSYLHTKYVLSILPYSLIGIFTGLALTGSSLSFPSIMGFIALSGIVVNNSILLIDMMNNLRRNRPELPLREVVLTAAGNRLRPILLTTITTIIGMIPLIFAGDLWSPLAYAVMFGLIFSVLITLVLIPITYYRNPGELPR